jgi:hypothetical protein
MTPATPPAPQPAHETEPNKTAVAGEEPDAQSDSPNRAQQGPQIVRARHLPPLPRDAFDNYLDSMQSF